MHQAWRLRRVTIRDWTLECGTHPVHRAKTGLAEAALFSRSGLHRIVDELEAELRPPMAQLLKVLWSEMARARRRTIPAGTSGARHWCSAWRSIASYRSPHLDAR